MLLICLSCAWVVGIWLGTVFNLPPALSLPGIIPLAALFFTRKYRKRLFLIGASIIIIVLAAGYSYSNLYCVDENHVRFYNDSGATVIKGTVTEAPDIRDSSMRLTVEVAEIKLEDGWRKADGKALVIVPRYPACDYGDYLLIEGTLETPPQVEDFDYRGYLSHRGIYTTVYYPHMEVLDTGRGFTPLSWVYSLRSRLADVLAEALPEPQAALAQGIILGIRTNIPDSLQDDFNVSGTTHLLAISGLNIGIMAGVLLGLGLWLFGRRRYLYVWLALGAVWFYALITGMNLPVVRGAFMASLFLVAEALGRQRGGVTALAFSAAIMVGIHPYVLGDASFQLSFLAVAGLIFIFPVLREYGRKIAAQKLGEEGILVSIVNVTIDTFSATLAATLAVWPVLAYYFGFISLIGPLATFLAMPALPLIIIVGSLTAVIGLLVPMAAHVLGWLVWLFLSYMIAVVSGLGSFSVASVNISPLHPVLVGGYYLLLTALIWLHGRWRKSKSAAVGESGLMKAGLDFSFGLRLDIKWFIMPLLLLAVLALYTAATMPGDDLRVSFLDVGEGDAVLIQQGSRQVLVDGGPSPQAITQELGRKMPFWDRTIDLVVMTHPHQDHLAGLLEVLRRYKVGQVLYLPVEYASPVYDEWLRLIDEKEIKSAFSRAGLQVTLGNNILLEVLGPPENVFKGTESDIDNNSVVLRLDAGVVSFLLPADIMSEAEWELARNRADIAGAVIKVSHHGSKTSTTNEFLSVVNPRVAVISCGEGNRFGHPDAVIFDKLIEHMGAGNVYRTDTQGTIDFVTDGTRLWVETKN